MFSREAAAKENLDFLSVGSSVTPDYLPYTYQRRAPYLLWDDGVSEESTRDCSCSGCRVATALLVIILVGGVFAVIGIVIYLGIITNKVADNLKAEDETFDGSLRVSQGDRYSSALIDRTSPEFQIKALTYETLLNTVYQRSRLKGAYRKAQVISFTNGSLIVHFRLHLDRRKLPEIHEEASREIRAVLLEELTSDVPVAFRTVKADITSVNISGLLSNDILQEHWADNFLTTGSNRSQSSTTDINNNETTRSSSTTSTTTTTHPPPSPSSPPPPPPIPEVPLTPLPPLPPPPPQPSPPTRIGGNVPHRLHQSGVSVDYGPWLPYTSLPQEFNTRLDRIIYPPSFSTSGSRLFNLDDERVSPIPFLYARGSASRINLDPNTDEELRSVLASMRPLNSATNRPRTDDGRELIFRMDSPALVISNKRNSSSTLPSSSSEENRKVDEDLVFRMDSPPVIVNPKRNLSSTSVPPTSRNPRLLQRVSKFSSTEWESAEPVSLELDDERLGFGVRLMPTERASPTSAARVIPAERFHKDATLKFQSLREPKELSNKSKITEEKDVDEGFSIEETKGMGPEMEPIKESLVQHQPITESLVQYEISTETFSEQEHKMENIEHHLPIKESLVQHVSPSELEFDDTVAHVANEEPVGESQVEYASKQDNQTSEKEESHLTAKQTTAVPMTSTEKQTPLPGTPTILGTAFTFEVSVKSDIGFPDTPQSVPTSSLPPTEEQNEERSNLSNDIVLESSNENNITYQTDSPLQGFSSATDDVVTTLDTLMLTEQSETVTTTAALEPFHQDGECSGPGKFQCRSGECLSAFSRCNRMRECLDNSDEEKCTCADFIRANVINSTLCDGIVDCWDYTDENQCEWCEPHLFVCPNAKMCIPRERVCDDISDCPGGEDERSCVTVAPNTTAAERGSYWSSGLVMVRRSGRWGKLCNQNFDNFVAETQVAVSDLGKVLCRTMGYRDIEDVRETKDASHEARDELSLYYEPQYNENATNSRSASVNFVPTNCASRQVIRVHCKEFACGRRQQPASSRARIVGGADAAPGSWPWQAAVHKEGSFMCGATLISDQWLISAGHCFYQAVDHYWTVRLGVLRRASHSPQEVVRRISHVVIHPNYISSNFINDIALLRLAEPVAFSDYIRPICLPSLESTERSIEKRHLCTVVGWGQMDEEGDFLPDTLQEVKLPLISATECRLRTTALTSYARVNDNMFCAGVERGGRDACLGDSGGPIMCQERDGRWTLTGITSNGFGCARASRPGIYTKVASYVAWITRVMSGPLPRAVRASCPGHRCELGKCLTRRQICDGFVDCLSGSDEVGCRWPNLHSSFDKK